jgi:hypothetical protein
VFDAQGHKVVLGSRVQLWSQQHGTVVCDFDTGEFSEGFPETEWNYLKVGSLIQMDSGEIYHYEEPDEDFVVLEDVVPNRSIGHL